MLMNMGSAILPKHGLNHLCGISIRCSRGWNCGLSGAFLWDGNPCFDGLRVVLLRKGGRGFWMTYKLTVMVIGMLQFLGKALNPKLLPFLPKNCVLPIWAEAEKALSIIDHTFHIIPAMSDHLLSQVSLWDVHTYKQILRSLSSPSYAVRTREQLPQVLYSCFWKSCMICLRMKDAILCKAMIRRHDGGDGCSDVPGLNVGWWILNWPFLRCQHIVILISLGCVIPQSCGCILECP